jgi:uncharacterized protein (DUF488 family)
MLNNRQKCLYYFIKKSNSCPKMKLAKIFFRIRFESGIDKDFKFYSFVPYKFGPYSFELFHDIEMMENEKIVSIEGNYINFLDGNVSLHSNISNTIDQYFEKNFYTEDKKLIDYVYEKYPEYTIFSEIEKKKEYTRNLTGIYSIGYEGLSIDEFLMKLIDEKIQILVDVRNNPWSMKFGFTKHKLEMFCEKMNIQYTNIPSLGIPSNLRQDLNDKKDYEELFKKYSKHIVNKKEELNYLRDLSTEKRIALMCFEKDPAYCHRRIIAEQLELLGAKVKIH